jgi:dTDP-4-dehydrorhamnose 3,5-epimerase
MDIVLSPKDSAAPSLHEAAEEGLLPTYADCRAYVDELRERFAD